eukprot:TRINITY_DN3689_c0_g1_i2.p1 TRINITY_DN3689_c0_g1~~TRINITY_DN3689_c0_g1_i2.p1  ORF type:complete len:432 (+),score=36.36 TRINITY_DN3689_c0_g1_i2:554-1849(+)
MALILDVDHTILHATMTKHIPYSLLSIMADLFFFKMSTDSDGSPIYCLVKLRPGLLTFLKTASRHFEIYLCTFGTATYAREVRHKLVELTGPNTLNSILISREQLLRPGDKQYRKDLDSIIKIIGNDVHPSYCVLIDDRHDVWSEDHARENLLRIHPYSFFLGHSQSTATPTQHHRRSEIQQNHLSQSSQEAFLPSSLQSFTSSTPPLSAPMSMRLNRSTDSTAKHFTEMAPTDAMPEISLSTSSIDDKCLQNAWGVLKYVHAAFFHTLDQTASETDMSLEERLMASHVRRSLRARRNAVLHGCHILYRGIAAEMAPLGPLFGATTVKDDELLTATHIVSQRLESNELSTLVESVKNRIRTSHSSASAAAAEADSTATTAPTIVEPLVPRRLFIVSYNWLRESLKNWKRADETPFLLTNPIEISWQPPSPS